ncbi:hypothetical protein LIER_15320 [Lithospermum erythrorhizon]|uniref:Reverse transcriptase Ty1/copia-type domain-containing protein n=1 Tax=Lithospermum erythrorhizon TaxID=34254 RepID=A0AAV3Q4X3_LITER
MDVHNAFLNGDLTEKVYIKIPLVSKTAETVSRTLITRCLPIPNRRRGLMFWCIYLYQRKYALDIIVETGLLGANPVAFPMEQNQKLGISQSPDMAYGAKYCRLVSQLLYLDFTQPHIGFTVHILS